MSLVTPDSNPFVSTDTSHGAYDTYGTYGAHAASNPLAAASAGSALSLSSLTLSQDFGAIAGVKKALVIIKGVRVNKIRYNEDI